MERERDGIDFSKVQLTRHELTHLSKRALSLSKSDASRLSPFTVVGSGMGKMWKSELLLPQTANNTKEPFSNSPDLNSEFKNATIASLDAHPTMATQVLNNSDAQRAMFDLPLNHNRLWNLCVANWRANMARRGHSLAVWAIKRRLRYRPQVRPLPEENNSAAVNQ